MTFHSGKMDIDTNQKKSIFRRVNKSKKTCLPKRDLAYRSSHHPHLSGQVEHNGGKMRTEGWFDKRCGVFEKLPTFTSLYQGEEKEGEERYRPLLSDESVHSRST